MHTRDEGEVGRMTRDVTLAKGNMKVRMLDLTQYGAFELIVNNRLAMKSWMKVNRERLGRR
jgi:hypothetical protein